MKNSFISDFNGKVGSRLEEDGGELFEFIHTIVKTNADNPGILSDDLKLFLMKLVNSIFEMTNKTEMEERKEIDEWEAEDW